MRRAARALLAVALAGVLLAGGCARDLRTIAIYHTSDVHGGLSARPARWYEPDPTRRIGGYAVLSSLIARESRPWVLLDSGDIFQGSPEGNLTLGVASVRVMNALGYTAMVIGNHEYDYGEANLRRLVGLAQFGVLGANITTTGDGAHVEYAIPTRIVEVGGVRVGLIGIATRHTKTSTLPANVAHLTFLDEVETARLHADRLRAEGADAIVVLCHCGLAPSVARRRVAPADLRLTEDDTRYLGDLRVARGAPVDLVLGGHLHTGLGPWRDPESGVVIVQSYQKLEAVTRLELVVDVDRGEVVSIDGALVDLWADEYGEDPRIVALLEEVTAEMGAALDERLGEAADDLLRAPGGLDSAMGNWMTDLMRAATGSDVAIQNTFGIREDLRAGPVRMRDVYEVMPFDNTLVTLRLSGARLEKLVRDNLRGRRSMIQVSGMRIRYHLEGETVGEVQLEVGGERVTGERIYTVVTNNYLAGGGTGGAAFTGAPRGDTGRPIRALLVEAFRSSSPIRAPATGRIQVVEP